MNKKYLILSMAVIAVLAFASVALAEDNKPEDATQRGDQTETQNMNQEREQNSYRPQTSTMVGEERESQADSESPEGQDNAMASSGASQDHGQKGKSEAEQHRSAVATFVQNLLKAASTTEGGIGDQVRAVAKEQDDSKDVVANAMQEVENRSGWKTFLVGTDYKNLGVIRSQIAKTQASLAQLNRSLEQASSSTLTTTTAQQIQNLTTEQTKLQNFVQQNESKFSLFGWFFKLFQ